MTAYLVAHPPHQRQFRERGTTASGTIVVHTAENTPDWVDHDLGAEGVARFIQGRSDFGSYHWLCDSDSIILMVPLNMQAYGDGTGSNPYAVHISGATQAAKWGAAPADWRRETVMNMAAAAARTAKRLDLDIPARRITRAQSDQRLPGFISHAERDPSRRTDPGAGFPWDLFLDTYRELMDPATPTPNISAALDAKTEEERRAALRRIIRHGSDEAEAEAQRWLDGIRLRNQGERKSKAARTALRALNVRS